MINLFSHSFYAIYVRKYHDQWAILQMSVNLAVLRIAIVVRIPVSGNRKNFYDSAWFPLVLRIVRIGDSYDFPTLGFLGLLRFLGQPCSHLSEESATAPDI